MEIRNITPMNNQNKISILQSGCGCQPVNKRSIDRNNMPHWASGIIETKAGPVYQVSTEWKKADHWGRIKARMSSFRMAYTVEPGIYAVGNPDKDSDVLVSANYKLSFDVLRRELRGINIWILVIDTKGINVWCAAGKGTFGTDELAGRIIKTGLSTLVDHRRIILPQLGAPGVSADSVKKRTGFKVHYGPVRAKDIPAYITDNYTATKEMRTVKFPMLDRLVLTPIELVPVFKAFPKFALIILVIFALQPSGILFGDAIKHGLPVLLIGTIAALAGAMITPVLLPFIPFRSFAIKGWIAGALFITPVLYYFGFLDSANIIFMAFAYLLFPALSSYLALQFTGASTYTNLSGVVKELRIAMPVYKTVLAVSVIILVVYKINIWGLI